MGILSVDLPNINLCNVNFHQDDPETIIHVRLMTWHNTFKQLKATKNISKELMPLACHPTRWWDWCMPEDKKIEIKQFLIDKKRYKGTDIVSTKINTFINCQLLNGTFA